VLRDRVIPEAREVRLQGNIARVGLYVAPPENAIVLCLDEKPSIQALARAQGYL
jgi:hypothetical protein